MADPHLVAKAEACAWAFRFRGTPPSRNAVRAVLKLAAQGEQCIGDAPGLEGNWGATDRRVLSNSERAEVTAGKTPTPRDPFEQLHGDSDPKTGLFQTWFHRSMEPDGKTPNDIRGACILLCDLQDLRGFTMQELEAFADDPNGFAKSLYERGYYRGFSTDPAIAEAAYAKKLAETTVDDGIVAWAPDSTIPARAAFYLRDGETAEDVYARAVAHYVGCDDGKGVDPDGRLLPHHRTPELVALYAITGDKAVEVSRLTNCGEFQLKLLGALGCPHELARMPYPQALQKHPEGALGMIKQIAIDLKALVASGVDCWKAFTRGRLCLYTQGDDAHEEGSQGTPDPSTGICDHAGAGRQGNAVAWIRDDVRRGPNGIPMVEVYATGLMIRVSAAPSAAAQPSVVVQPDSPATSSTTIPPAAPTTPAAPATPAKPALPQKPAWLTTTTAKAAAHTVTAAMAGLATFLATAKTWFENHEAIVLSVLAILLLLALIVLLSHFEAKKAVAAAATQK